jgi:hypothetical protein
MQSKLRKVGTLESGESDRLLDLPSDDEELTDVFDSDRTID